MNGLATGLTVGGSIVSGFVAGGLGALVTPWAAWGVEKRRARDAARRELVKSWRDGVNAASAELDSRVSVKNSQLVDLFSADWYRTLRGHLSDDERSAIEAPAGGFDPEQPGVYMPIVNLTMEPRPDPFSSALSAAIDRLERDWRLS